MISGSPWMTEKVFMVSTPSKAFGKFNLNIQFYGLMLKFQQVFKEVNEAKS
jgi:hypothetical protein